MRESSSIERNSRGVMKVKSGPDEGAARGDAVSIQTGAAASRGRSKQRPQSAERTQSVHVGTRKMVTYA